MVPKRSWFIIRVGDEEWAPFSWYRVRRPPLQIQDGSRANQESGTEWCTQTYRQDWVESHPKFLPELTQNIIPGLFYKRIDTSWNFFQWSNENRSIIRRTLVSCCLVSREWNRIFTPILYEHIVLGGRKPFATRSLLHRTFCHAQPAHKALVKKMTIRPAMYGSTANLLSICFSTPNLHTLILNFDTQNFKLSALHPNFTPQLRSLSKRCNVQLVQDYRGYTSMKWELLASYITFARRSKLTSSCFDMLSAFNPSR